jgi:predicted amidophosphoribosyltransferase
MILCPTCGADNQTGEPACRLCTAPLHPAEGQPPQQTQDSVPTTEVLTGRRSGKLTCPSCQAVNENSWVFCTECGSNMQELIAEVKPEPPARACGAETPLSPDQLKTVPSAPQCVKCAEPLVQGASFCHRCGASAISGQTVAMSSVKKAPRASISIVIEGEETDEEYGVDQGAVIGRVSGDITFPYDDYMSGRHAKIVKRGGKFILKDEGSRNGTFIQVDEIELKPGDIFMVGRQIFRFKY